MKLVSILFATASIAASKAHYEFSEYKSAQHIITIDQGRHVMSIWPSSVHVRHTHGAARFQPTNMREWSSGGACGIETPAWTFVIPPRGATEIRYDRWKYVAERKGADARSAHITVFEDGKGRILSFSYSEKKGIETITIGGYPVGRPERFVLTHGNGLLQGCLAAL
jgi:hypothetical protein